MVIVGKRIRVEPKSDQFFGSIPFFLLYFPQAYPRDEVAYLSEFDSGASAVLPPSNLSIILHGMQGMMFGTEFLQQVSIFCWAKETFKFLLPVYLLLGIPWPQKRQWELRACPCCLSADLYDGST